MRRRFLEGLQQALKADFDSMWTVDEVPWRPPAVALGVVQQPRVSSTPVREAASKTGNPRSGRRRWPHNSRIPRKAWR